METFTLTPSKEDPAVSWACIGPLESALQASIQIQRQEPPPTCWSVSPSASFGGGTVLVHDVDMRVPAVPGAWNAGKLLHYGSLVGGMTWSNSEVGDIENAAKLIYIMEDGGASVICNVEGEQVLSQGIRFIGRYSWEPKVSEHEISHRLLDQRDDLLLLTSGPTCLFTSPEVMDSKVVAFVESHLQNMKDYLNQKVAALQAQGYHESYPGDLHFRASHDRNDSTLRQMRLPVMENYGQRGVGFTFTDHEYLFGRLWFNVQGLCKAFCFYTYAAPEFFAVMSLEDCPVCPQLPGIPEERRDDSMKWLCETLLIKPDTETKQVLDGLTSIFRDFLLSEAMKSSPDLIKKIFVNHIIDLDEKTFSMFFRRPYGPASIHHESMKAVLDAVNDSVLRQAGELEVQRFHVVSQDLLDGSFPFHEISRRTMDATMPSHLGLHIDCFDIFNELVRRGYPVNSVLAATGSNGWFRTVLADACYYGKVEQVKLLLDAGANVDEVVGGDPWNAIAYASVSGNPDVVNLLRERFPNHTIWTSDSIPIKMKIQPRRNLWGDATTNNQQATAAPLPLLGTLDDIANDFHQDK